MVSRLFLAITIILLLGAKSWACSCGEWSGFVSDYSQDYLSVWAVPTQATVNMPEINRPTRGVTYTLDILEGFERTIKSEIEVSSSVEDGGSCGVQLRMGLPQLISAYKFDEGKYGISSCTPYPPYSALKLYLEKGQDTYIPKFSECYGWTKNSENREPVFNSDREECSVWKDAEYDSYYYGEEDLSKYRKIWWDEIESINSE